MAILRGRDGTVNIAIGGTATAIGEVTSWNISMESDTLETTAMGTGGWKTFIGSLQSWSGTVEVYVDDDAGAHDVVSQVCDNSGGAAVAVILTDGTNGNTYTGTAVVTSISVDVASADLVTATMDLTGSGALVLT
jgi:hypothetical protein